MSICNTEPPKRKDVQGPGKGDRARVGRRLFGVQVELLRSP